MKQLATSSQLAVIDEKLAEINNKLSEIREYIRTLEKEKDELAHEYDFRIGEIEKMNAKQVLINTILGTVGGSALAGVVAVLLQKIFGG